MDPRNPGSTNNAPHEQSSPDNGSSSSQYQFDWLNWFYWNMWWQQYSYWAWSQNQSNPLNQPTWDTTHADQRSTQPTTSTNTQWNQQNNQYFPYNPFYQFNNPAVAPTWAGNYPGQPHAEGGMAQPQNFLTLQIRIINGFETYIAAAWKRFVAEVIDTFLFALLLKAYLPEADLRIPEILFEGSEVWAAIEEEEDLDEIQRVLQTFLFSIFMQRVHHAILEAVWISVFSCTPGKWLMGLRVLRCNSTHLTRTHPGWTIRVVPAGRVSLMKALVRSVFKAVFSLFCPLVIFFFALRHGQTKYDKILRCAVVDARTLYRPVHSNRGQGSSGPQVVQMGQ
jgi:uncharacterized RDD family membrane protein YckC